MILARKMELKTHSKYLGSDNGLTQIIGRLGGEPARDRNG